MASCEKRGGGDGEVSGRCPESASASPFVIVKRVRLSPANVRKAFLPLSVVVQAQCSTEHAP